MSIYMHKINILSYFLSFGHIEVNREEYTLKALTKTRNRKVNENVGHVLRHIHIGNSLKQKVERNWTRSVFGKKSKDRTTIIECDMSNATTTSCPLLPFCRFRVVALPNCWCGRAFNGRSRYTRLSVPIRVCERRLTTVYCIYNENEMLTRRRRENTVNTVIYLITENDFIDLT